MTSDLLVPIDRTVLFDLIIAVNGLCACIIVLLISLNCSFEQSSDLHSLGIFSIYNGTRNYRNAVIILNGFLSLTQWRRGGE